MAAGLRVIRLFAFRWRRRGRFQAEFIEQPRVRKTVFLGR